MANKQARLLAKKIIDGVTYQPNQVIEADAALIKALVKEGAADDSGAAVKHCIEQEGVKPVLHVSPEDKAAAEARQAEIDRLTSEISKLQAEWTAAADADKAAIEQAVAAKQAELAKL
ncbi:MAG: hypothetical protein M0Q22_15450 [Sulfuritalea sp.]|jgi:hypothetical protein|nr:hypothetical protein [Sulfuritalea sp.]